MCNIIKSPHLQSNRLIFLFNLLPGHSWILQLSVCLADPEHGDPNRKFIGDPSFWAVVLTCLDLSLTPAPHVFEHDDQSLQEVHSQSTVTISRKGQASLEFLCNSIVICNLNDNL